MPNLHSLIFFIPELILAGGSLALILMSAGQTSDPDPRACRPADLPTYISIIALLASLAFTIKQFSFGSPPLFWGLLILDKPAVFFKLIFNVTAILIILFSCHCERQNGAKQSLGQNCKQEIASSAAGGLAMTRQNTHEYYALILGAVLGMNLLASANNILMIYLALEFVSLVSYLLVGWDKTSPRSSEAALKYVLYGAVASGVFLFGASLYYGLTASLDINNISALATGHRSPATVVAGLLILAGFLYKIAAVPLQAWCPDAYEGAPTPITAFLSVAPKAAGFAVLMRVFAEVGVSFGWPLVIAVVSAITMTFGNLCAIPQTNLKRLLAYSSIAHAGYLLMGVACATAKGFEAVYFYFIAYLIMNLGAFLVVQICGCQIHRVSSTVVARFIGQTDWPDKSGNYDMESISSYIGLARRGPYGVTIAIAMTIFLLSLTGVPPFFGFIGKFYLFSAVIDAKLYWLAIIGIMNSVVSLYYYMRIVKAMFFDDSPEAATQAFLAPPRTLFVILIILALATIFFGLYWQAIGQFISFIKI